MNTNKNIEEKILNPKAGMPMLLANLLGIVLGIVLIIWGATMSEETIVHTAYGTEYHSETPTIGVAMIVFSAIVLIPACSINFAGLKALSPNEALVLTLFGKYYGTIVESGYYYVNPFCSAYNPTKAPAVMVTSSTTPAPPKEKNNQDNTSGKKISMKEITLKNRTQKVNDLEGNPIEIAIMVIWKVSSPSTAVFAVDNYLEYISLQADSTLRNVACRYAYDLGEESDKSQLSLRGDSEEIALTLQKELQTKVETAGLEVVEVKITHLAYAQEIAAAMLQRQQASAILAARRLIVDGAVGMVQQALAKLDDENIVELDDERKATMISNLLVVLCANKEAQPVVNSGSIY